MILTPRRAEAARVAQIIDLNISDDDDNEDDFKLHEYDIDEVLN